jgi:hypothetical protein
MMPLALGQLADRDREVERLAEIFELEFATIA